MKTIIVRNYDTFHHRASDTKFESRAINLDEQGACFMGVAVVDDDVATEHFMNRDGFLVFEESAALMTGTARRPASASTEDTLTREPTDAELDHAEECRIEAERAAAVRDGALVEAKPSKPTRKQLALAAAEAKAETERAQFEAEAQAKAEAEAKGE